MNGLFALCFAACKMDDIQISTAVQKDPVSHFLKFAIHDFNQLLAINGSAQQGFQNK